MRVPILRGHIGIIPMSCRPFLLNSIGKGRRGFIAWAGVFSGSRIALGGVLGLEHLDNWGKFPLTPGP